MLEHMIKAQILDRVIRGMDVLIRIREIGFNNES